MRLLAYPLGGWMCVVGGLSACKRGDTLEGGASGQALLDAVKMGDSRRVEFLLGEGVHTEVRDENGDTSLLYAVKTGNVELVRMMLKQDVDHTARSGNGKGALELAIDSGSRKVVRCLLAGGVSPDEMGYDSNPLLFKAVRFKDMDTIGLLLQYGVAPGVVGKDGRTALHVAAEGGLMECMEVLLSAGADPDVQDDGGVTPLWLAVSFGGSAGDSSGVKRLLVAGADVNVWGPGQVSVLGESVRKGRYRDAVVLVNHGAEVNFAGADLPSPVMLAAEKNDKQMLAMLLLHGADGSELFYDALKKSDTELIRLIFDTGGKVSGRELPGGDGLIAFCVRKGDIDLLRLCLQCGGDPKKKGSEGQSPLHMAIAKRDAAMVRVLLEHGVSSNVYFSRPVSKAFLDLVDKKSMRWFLQNERRLTPLMMAANNGDTGVIKALLDHGARRYVYSSRHRLYPLNFASRRNDVRAMQVILGQDPEKESYHAVLDLSEQCVRLYNAKGEVVLKSRVSTGRAGFRTPKGTFVITDKHRTHNSTIYGSSMPYFQRLSCSAFGFHAGNCPGYPASHGCIRMPYRAAKKLFSITPVGTRVVIQQ